VTFTEFLDLVLVRLYEFGDRGGFHSVNTIADELRSPVPHDWSAKAANVLKDRGLVNAYVSAGDSAGATITGEGMLYVESKSHETSVIETYRTQPSIYINVTGGSNQFAVTESGSITQTQVVGNQAEILALLERIVDALRTAPIADDEREDYLVEIETAKRQLTKRTPNLAAARALLEPLGSVAAISELVLAALRLIGHG